MPCKSATIPVAVSFSLLGQLHALFATGFILGRRSEGNKSEDLPYKIKIYPCGITGGM